MIFDYIYSVIDKNKTDNITTAQSGENLEEMCDFVSRIY
jgi:hypothetical protein